MAAQKVGNNQTLEIIMVAFGRICRITEQQTGGPKESEDS